MEVTTMFQIELLSGGVFWVYAVHTATDDFLIWKDNAWQWTPMDWCKPYYQPWIGVTSAVSEPPDGKDVLL